MATQLSIAVRNARADAVESTIGASPTLELRTGAQPADCAQPDSGTLIASMALPADWMGSAVNGVKALAGTWQDLSADNTGTIGHFRIKDSGGTVHVQGSVSEAGGGGDIILDNTDVNAGQSITITSFGWTEPNA